MNSSCNGARIRGKALFRTSVPGGSVLALSALLVAGCTGAPTYGTGTPADEQLLQDISGAMTLTPKKKEPIAYAPRPGLVLPPSTEVLPPPQEDIATTDNPAWPESPEQRLARIRAEATANQDDPNYKADIVRDVSTSSTAPKPRNRWNETPTMENAAATREQFNKRLAATKQGSPTTRRYLSDPPIEYRKPAETAPADDVGVEEWKKEREAKRAARKSSNTGLRGLIPWL